jgi:hypothetical protein
MAKATYKPTSMLDPLGALRQATAQTPESPAPAAVEEPLTSPLPEAPEQTTATTDVRPATRLSVAPVKPVHSALKPSRNTVYLYPEDLTKLRRLGGYASSEHGIRANDSMIVRAALSLVEADVRFMHALKDAELSDRRRTK